MDPFYFDLQDVDDDYLMSFGGDVILPPPPPPPPPQGSAFAAYHRELLLSRRGRYTNSGGGGANVHRRMFGYLRRVGSDAAAASSMGNATSAQWHAHPEPAADRDDVVAAQAAPRGTPRFRHIMRERLRRERLSQGFADLHALLPPGVSKGGKNDVVGAAVGYIRELERRKERLRGRNDELLLEQAARSGGRGMVVVKVRAESEQHTAAVDVFEMVLRRLKAVEELRVTGIRSCFRDDGGMWMDVGVECKQVSAGDVDKAITNAVAEIEESALRMQVPRSSKPTFSCHVEKGVPM